MADLATNNMIDAEPTKGFFIDMFTRDIPLDQAILDLVDNSVDGAKSGPQSEDGKFTDLWIKIEFDKDHFQIIDNCGGFSRQAAREYAFKFGRPAGAARTPHSIGQFGVGMKRALFKFGRNFTVSSSTTDEAWQLDVSVDSWELAPGWTFPMDDLPQSSSLHTHPGTEITVTSLRPEVASRFGQAAFTTTIFNLIKSKHRQFISAGLSISVNGRHVDATSLTILTNQSQLRPGVQNLKWTEDGQDITARIIVAVGPSMPKLAGWYVVCNGRVILEADRSPITGWGLFEDAKDRIMIPSFHNQFARFRGIIYFESNDSSKVPWNTTKTGVDEDNKYWRDSFQTMISMMRPVINFLNDLDNDIEEHSKDKSPLHDFVAKSTVTLPDNLRANAPFTAPARDSVVKGPRMVSVQYYRASDDIEILQEAFGVSSARAVGEASFDAALRKQKR